ncbi:dUTP diphosphatase [Oceanobacillus jeddahense]|uniref:dUTP diphosphatase n=1 Tax=Oceanobacillus jeddahense TaxID=1462527 RepID=A0ABY5JY77_9BACI|nr:dUTP diphosphatase [Oceanobacillus jeddahense]UUI05271.1 dUTP diphosphatase [Oceanobacillus jeddahense]
MDWNQLFEMQKELDTYIENNHDLSNVNLFQEKHLALLVELGELANETRCFKFWSTKPRNSQQIILEEYVDVLHFLMSIGIEKGYIYQEEKGEKTEPLTESECFYQVYAKAIAYREDPVNENYQQLFKWSLQLGNQLGFTDKDIQQAYLEKNQVNYQRQDQGY